MSWTVEFFNETAREELEALPEDIRARFERIVNLIKTKGLEQVHEPYVNTLKASFGKCA